MFWREAASASQGAVGSLDHTGIKHRTHPPPAAIDTEPGLALGVAPPTLPSASGLAEPEPGTPDTDKGASGRLRLDHSGSGRLLDDDSSALEPPSAYGALQEAFSRGRWLLGLLIVQSTSSFVLDHYQALLRNHVVVVLFLTMLVGAGGNAGNQSAIKVIRLLATGSIRQSWQSFKNMMAQQAAVALLLGGGLAIGGFFRVWATNGTILNAVAISLSLFLIVMTSVILGTGLPFLLARGGIDPANAGTSIQVVMDILGVAITCVTCNLLLVQFAHGVKEAQQGLS